MELSRHAHEVLKAAYAHIESVDVCVEYGDLRDEVPMNTKILTGIRELEVAGVLKRHRDEKGRFLWFLASEPLAASLLGCLPLAPLGPRSRLSALAGRAA